MILELLAQTTQPVQTMQPTATGLTAPAANIIVGCLVLTGAIVGAIVGLLNLRYQAIAGRYKTYIETYKIAKEVGLTDKKDEEWAKRVLSHIEKDLSVRFRYPLILGIGSMALGFVCDFLSHLVDMRSSVTDVLCQGLMWFGCFNLAIYLITTVYRDAKQMYRDFPKMRQDFRELRDSTKAWEAERKAKASKT